MKKVNKTLPVKQNAPEIEKSFLPSQIIISGGSTGDTFENKFIPNILPSNYQINGYCILEKLGDGNSCVVYKVCKDNQFYALKQYHLNLIDRKQQEKINYQFERECTIFQENISHKNILKIIEVNNEQKYIITELTNGELRKHLQENYQKYSIFSQQDQKKFLNEQVIQYILFQLLFALKALHSRNIIHRDIKLQNSLCINENGLLIIKLADFGVSKKLNLDEINQEQTFVGSSHYLSPEAKGDHGKVESQNPESDIFSLGITIYDLCLGNELFLTGKGKYSVEENPHQNCYLSLSQYYSKNLERILNQMLAKCKDQRSNVTALLNDPYFSKIKQSVIEGILKIVDPYLICLYEFENCESAVCEKHIEFLLSSLIKSTQHACRIQDVILLKMKLLLYLDRHDELAKFTNMMNTHYQNIFKNLLTNLDFKKMYYSFVFQGEFNQGKEVNAQVLDNYWKLHKLYPSKSVEVVSLGWELNAIQDLMQHKEEYSKRIIGSSIDNAIRNYLEVFNDRNIGINFSLYRLYFIKYRLYGFLDINQEIDNHFLEITIAFFKDKNANNISQLIDFFNVGYCNLKNQRKIQSLLNFVSNIMQIFISGKIKRNEMTKTGLAHVYQKIFLDYFNIIYANRPRVYFLYNAKIYLDFVKNLCDPIITNALALIFFNYDMLQDCLHCLDSAYKMIFNEGIYKELRIQVVSNICMILFKLGRHKNCQEFISKYFNIEFNIKKPNTILAIMNLSSIELEYDMPLQIGKLPDSEVNSLPLDLQINIAYLKIMKEYKQKETKAINNFFKNILPKINSNLNNTSDIFLSKSFCSMIRFILKIAYENNNSWNEIIEEINMCCKNLENKASVEIVNNLEFNLALAKCFNGNFQEAIITISNIQRNNSNMPNLAMRDSLNDIIQIFMFLNQ